MNLTFASSKMMLNKLSSSLFLQRFFFILYNKPVLQHKYWERGRPRPQ